MMVAPAAADLKASSTEEEAPGESGSQAQEEDGAGWHSGGQEELILYNSSSPLQQVPMPDEAGVEGRGAGATPHLVHFPLLCTFLLYCPSLFPL